MGKTQAKLFTINDSLVQITALLTSSKDSEQQKDECCLLNCLSDFEFCLPFFPPTFPIKMNPFLISKYKQSNTQNSLEPLPRLLNPLKNNQASKVIYHEFIIKKIMTFLSYQEHKAISNSCKRFMFQVEMFYFQRQHNWDIINLRLQPYQNNQSYLKYSSVDEQSEHSLDLDRSSAFLQCESENGDTKIEQQSKLDRVLTALSFSIGYFQGLNSITATILAFYEEQRAYWVIRYLVYRSDNMANNTNNYHIFIDTLDAKVQQILPQVYNHLEIQGLNVQYFAMRWVLALFSYDLDKSQLMTLWGLICDNGSKMLLCFIVSLLQFLQPKILQLKTNGLNNLLKHNLKQSKFITQRSFQQIIQKTKQLFLVNKYKPSNLKLQRASQDLESLEFKEIQVSKNAKIFQCPQFEV